MMEELRKQILLYLEKHSRVDLGELAVLLGSDEVTVANEISAMERAKIICGYHTLIDWDKTGTEYVNALIEVKVTDGERKIILVTENGMSICFDEKDIRITGRVSMGVIGIKLDEGDEVVAMQLDIQGEYLLIVSENGLGKRTLISEFHPQNRNGKGLKCYKITEKTGKVIGAKAVNEDDEIMMITNEGIVIRTDCASISVLKRITSGVKLMHVDSENGIKVANIAKVREQVRADQEDQEEQVESDEENPSDGM